MTLGQRMRNVRKEAGFTLEYVAGIAKISIPHLSEIERDRKLPPLDTLARIVRPFGLSVAGLLWEVEQYGEPLNTSRYARVGDPTEIMD